MDWLLKANDAVNAYAWGVPMLVLLVGTGIYITIRTGAIQFSRFGLMCRETMGKIFRRGPKAEGDVTPFQAMTVAMGGTVGVGNIAGVATAIGVGGPGALFWMFVSGLIGMATKFAEVTLGVHYRVRESGQPMMGGPMMYISRGLGKNWKWLAAVFCIFGAIAGLGIGNMTQSNSVADGMKHFNVAPWATGIVLTVAVGVVTIGGIKWIANVAMFCVPFMCSVYMLGAFWIIVTRIADIPEVASLVFRYAFSTQAAVGGAAGYGIRAAIRMGISRGVFSNEAGMGSAPMAHATATTDHPARQGLWGVFEVFFDTIIMCSATGLAILLTGVWTGEAKGAQMTMAAFGSSFGGSVGPSIVVFCMILTAYDTVLAWCFYGETCAAFLFGHGKVVRLAYRLLWLPFIYLGATGSLKAIWNIADTLNALMALPNLIALVVLAPIVVKLTRGFLAGKPYEPPNSESE